MDLRAYDSMKLSAPGPAGHCYKCDDTGVIEADREQIREYLNGNWFSFAKRRRIVERAEIPCPLCR